MKKVVIKRIASDNETPMYYKTKLSKGLLHYVFRKEEATRISFIEAKKIISEMKYKERFEIVEVK